MPDHSGAAGLDDAGLLSGDLDWRGAEPLDMIHGDGGDDGDIGIRHVRRVPDAAETDLDDCHVHRGIREGGEGHAGDDLEEREARTSVGFLLGVHHSHDGPDVLIHLDEALVADGFAVDADPLGDRLQMRAGVGPDAQAVATSKVSSMRAVDVLPLVPVMCTIRGERCGSPSRSMTRCTRRKVGTMSVSGWRANSSPDTSDRSGLGLGHRFRIGAPPWGRFRSPATGTTRQRPGRTGRIERFRSHLGRVDPGSALPRSDRPNPRGQERGPDGVGNVEWPSGGVGRRGRAAVRRVG